MVHRRPCFLVAGLVAATLGAACSSRASSLPPTAAPVVTSVETSAPDTSTGPTSAPSAAPAGTTSLPPTPDAAFDPLEIVVAAAVAPAGTTVEGSLHTADGRERTYHVYVPATLPAAAPVPLLIALHGGTGWGTQFERNSGFDGLAEANGFIVVYPDGIGIGADGASLRTWNGGSCCGPAVKQQVDDVGFVGALIATLETTYDIDPQRVVAAGHSNGGVLAYRLACELSDQIAAIGVQSTALEIPTCAPAKPVSVLHIHGSADQNIPIEGGIGPKAVSGVSFNRPLDGAVTLAAADDCPATPAQAVDAANPDVTVTSWAPCNGGTEVAFVQVQGASHAWMGHSTGGSGLVGEPYSRLDSSLVIWNFLATHMRG